MGVGVCMSEGAYAYKQLTLFRLTPVIDLKSQLPGIIGDVTVNTHHKSNCQQMRHKD